MLEPVDFVLHLHSGRENRTCHWGFDADHWRSYVHVDEDAYCAEDSAEAEAAARANLDQCKRRFAHPKLKRKQVGGTSNTLYNL